MTADATKAIAELWPLPCAVCGPDFLGTCPHRPAARAPAPQVNRIEPAISAVYAVDLKPLISHFASELQRERDRVAVERTTASSAREALAACEERLVARRKACERAEASLEHAQSTIQEMAADMAKLRGELNDARQALDDEREWRAHDQKLASTAAASPAPGSTAAVIEAYRLLTGLVPVYDNGKWLDSRGLTVLCRDAGLALLYHLDEIAPGGRP